MAAGQLRINSLKLLLGSMALLPVAGQLTGYSCSWKAHLIERRETRKDIRDKQKTKPLKASGQNWHTFAHQAGLIKFQGPAQNQRVGKYSLPTEG